MLIFIRRSYVCVAPYVPAKAGPEKEPCVALYTDTHARGRKQTAAGFEWSRPVSRFPCCPAPGAALRA